MFFKKKNNEDQICRFCVNAKTVPEKETVSCTFRGEVDPFFSCKKFSYDLLKREPGKTRKLEPMEYVDINN